MLSLMRIRVLYGDGLTRLSTQLSFVAVGYLLFTIMTSDTAEVPTRPGGKIENPTGKYLCWEDSKIEVNQYGGLAGGYRLGAVRGP